MSREHKIIHASLWSVGINTLLAVLKLTVGFLSGSYAVIADGIDSASDVASSLVVLFAARIISRPPNIRYSYGYQKADTMAAKILSMVIFFAGFQLAWSTIRELTGGTGIAEPSALAIWVTLASIVGKIILTFLLMRTGKKLDSPMRVANARNMRNYILISLGVLISLVVSVYFEIPLVDRIIALLISAFIIFSAYRIFQKTNIDLMDGIDDTSLYKRLFEAVANVDGASNAHRVRARKIGYYYMVNLDIEVDAQLSVREAHDIARNVENSIKSEISNVYDVMVHVEPLGNKEDDEKYGISEKEIKKG